MAGRWDQKTWMIHWFSWSAIWFLRLGGVSGLYSRAMLPSREASQTHGLNLRSLSFDGNFDLENFTCLDAASVVDTVPNNSSELHLTKGSTSPSYGRCLYKHSIPLVMQSVIGYVSSFRTIFQFYVEDPSGTGQGEGEGMTFLLVYAAASALNSSGGYLGLLNSTRARNAPSTFAVEVDTKQQVELADPSYHHIGLDIDSLHSLSCSGLSPNANDSSVKVQPGVLYNVWVNWNATLELARVSLAAARSGSPKPDWSSVPTYQLSASLSVLQGAMYTFRDPNMYVGFSSSTGNGSSNAFRVTYWNFEYWDFQPHFRNSNRRKLVLTIVLSTLCIFLLLTLVVLITSFWLKWRVLESRKVASGRMPVGELEDLDEEYGPRCFSYKELSTATKSFSSKQLLGKGGFGYVYKGTLRKTNKTVAVKRISQTSRQGTREFLAEVKIIGRLRHKNLVQLLGWCFERGDMLLVYEYMANGSLDRSLFSSDDERYEKEVVRPVLSWKERVKIISGVASALVYLHEEWEHRVVHRDVKSSNVMLDIGLNARLGDFGLARQYAHSQAPFSTAMAGTLGYLPPEFLQSCRATEKTDVFSFGVVALETVTARRPLKMEAGEMVVLVDWVWDLFKDKRELEAVDRKLAIQSEEVEKEMKKVIQLALLCCHPDPKARPTMRQALHILSWDGPIPPVPRSKPVAYYRELVQEEGQVEATTDEESGTLFQDSFLSRGSSSVHSVGTFCKDDEISLRIGQEDGEDESTGEELATETLGTSDQLVMGR